MTGALLAEIALLTRHGQEQAGGGDGARAGLGPDGVRTGKAGPPAPAKPASEPAGRARSLRRNPSNHSMRNRCPGRNCSSVSSRSLGTWASQDPARSEVTIASMTSTA